MTSIALPGLDLSQILAAGQRRRMKERSPWHEEAAATYSWHASSMGDCGRAQMLKRRGLDLDGHTEESQGVFELGDFWHKQFEQDCIYYMEDEPRFKVHAVEAGGRHPTHNLKARVDMLCSWDGEFVLVDYKTEQGVCPYCKKGAKTFRENDARTLGLPYSYKLAHHIQLATGTVITEALLPFVKIHSGRVVYLNKNTGSIDQVPVPITQRDREWVLQRVQTLEAMYGSYEASGWKQLPAQLENCPTDEWKCRPRSTTDPRGRWCPCREACMKYAELGL